MAFFACTEISLMAMNRYRLRHMARMKKHYAIRLLRLLNHPDRFFGAMRIGSTLTAAMASSLVTLLAYSFWGSKGALLVAILFTIIILIIAKIVLKTIAASYPEKVSRWVA